MGASFEKDHILIDLYTYSKQQQAKEKQGSYKGEIFLGAEDTYYIRYKETDEEHAETQNTLKISPQQVKVIRHGKTNMNQTYTEGKKTTGHYQTPYGAMKMETETICVHFRWNEEIGQLYLEYDLSINQQNIDRIALELNLRQIPST